MKSLIKALFPLAAACSAPVPGDLEMPEGEVLGTLKQAIYVPYAYGAEGDQKECIAPWAGGICRVPDQRKLDIWFETDTCSSQFTIDRIFESIDFWFDMLKSVGWDVNLYYTVATPSNAQKTTKIYVKCGNAGASPAMFTPGNYDDHGTQYGTLKQFRNGTLTVDENYFYSSGLTAFWEATGPQQVYMVYNVISHEFGHAVGLGHVPQTSPPMLMQSPGWSLTNLQGAGLNGPLGPSTWQMDMLDCYNPNSGTGSGC